MSLGGLLGNLLPSRACEALSTPNLTFGLERRISGKMGTVMSDVRRHPSEVARVRNKACRESYQPDEPGLDRHRTWRFSRLRSGQDADRQSVAEARAQCGLSSTMVTPRLLGTSVFHKVVSSC